MNQLQLHSVGAAPAHTPPEWPAPAIPFGASIDSLLAIAAEETGAVGYALYAFNNARRCFDPALRKGLPLRVPAPFPVTVVASALRLAAEPEGSAPALITLPLRGRIGPVGVLDFGFAEPTKLTAKQLDVVHRTAGALERLLSAGEANLQLGQLVERIAQLERVLAEQVLAERARGLTEDAAGLEGRAEALHGHIERVLGQSPTAVSLFGRLADLENRLRHRRLISQAKLVLQRKLGLSEEKAYLALRSQSRRTRTPMPEVARQALDGENLAALQRCAESL